MAKVFLDTNSFIDAIHRSPEKEILELLLNHIVSISPLSIHIYCYIFKIKIPDAKVTRQQKKFQIIELTDTILQAALQGPTTDFEDNVQLHSCETAQCDIFLTEDKDLLKMKFFGKARILSSEEFSQRK